MKQVTKKGLKIISINRKASFNYFFNEILEALLRGENIEIRGFGIFKTVIRKARTGRNPKNSNPVEIPEKKAIKWKMSKILFKRLNKNFTENKISATY